MKCMLCGRENPDDAFYCGGCGWPQKQQKGGFNWKLVLVGVLVVAVLAAAAVIFLRPAPAAQPVETQTPATEPTAQPLSGERYELVAKTFVETYWNNDMPTLETLVEYHLFNYLEEELDTGSPVDCAARATQSAACDGDRIMDLQMVLGVTITEAYAVTVDYTTPEKSGSIVVTVGMVDGAWVVVSYVPFYAD